MRIAETVTFGGSGLDRAGDLRSDPAALAQALAQPDASAIALWRGKPLAADVAPDRPGARPGLELARLPLDHPILREASADPVLLGRDETGAPIVAHDLSAWDPGGSGDARMDSFQDRSEQHHPALPPFVRFRELRAMMTRLSPRDAELAASARAVIGWHHTHRFCAQCGSESRITQAGWQRSCPACGAHHFPRTDPVVIMLITHGDSVLVGRSPGWPQGMFSCLAGFVEPGETLPAAVRREVLEETGVTVGPVRFLASQPWPFPASLMLGCHGEALSTELTPDPNEIEEALWLSRSDLLEVFAGNHPAVMPPRHGAIAGFLLRNWLADRLD